MKTAEELAKIAVDALEEKKQKMSMSLTSGKSLQLQIILSLQTVPTKARFRLSQIMWKKRLAKQDFL